MLIPEGKGPETSARQPPKVAVGHTPEVPVRDRPAPRHVLPARANYLGADHVLDRPTTTSYGPTLVTGENDPLLPYLKRHLDEAQKADLLASFILESGVALLEGHLKDLLDRNGRVRILTGDYLGITEPNALLRLLDLSCSSRRMLGHWHECFTDLLRQAPQDLGDCFHSPAWNRPREIADDRATQQRLRHDDRHAVIRSAGLEAILQRQLVASDLHHRREILGGDFGRVATCEIRRSHVKLLRVPWRLEPLLKRRHGIHALG